MEGEGVGDGALQDDEILQINSKHIWILVARHRRKKNNLEEKIKNELITDSESDEAKAPEPVPMKCVDLYFF